MKLLTDQEQEAMRIEAHMQVVQDLAPGGRPVKIEYDKTWCERMAQLERLQEALDAADQGKSECLLGLYPMAAQVLADEVRAMQQRHAEETAVLREALSRLRKWGGMGGMNYSGSVVIGVVRWFDDGATGPLPDLPDYARQKDPT